MGGRRRHAVGVPPVFVFSLLLSVASMASADDDGSDPAICEKGGKGLAFPLLGTEHTWPKGLQVCAYLFGLIYMFLGVSIIADLFMEAIEVITSTTKEVKVGGKTVEYKVWNATVANLTLMALGSSAPEILLSVIEIFSGNFFSGALGPSTIVGSAAFNLLCILAVCMVALPDGEGRRIAEPDVFAVTAVSSIFAYLWILIILQFSTPNIVTVEEGVATFMFFPALVAASYAADQGWFRSKKVLPDAAARIGEVSGGGMNQSQGANIAKQIQLSLGANANDDKTAELVKLLALQQIKPSRAAQRMNAIRSMTGGKRVLPPAQKMNSRAAVATMTAASADPESGLAAATVPVVQFSTDIYMVCEGDGKVFAVVTRVPAKGKCSVAYESVGGTATSDVDFVSVKGVLEFGDGEAEKRIGVEIIDDDEPEDDEYFNLKLSDPKGCSLGEWATTTVIIIDDDEPGDIGFDQANQEVSVIESKEMVELTVRRFNGSKGRIECKFKTKDMNVPNAAKAGQDYVETEGTVVFEAQQMQQLIRIPLIDDDKFERDEIFKVVLFDPKGPTSDVSIHTHDDGSSAGDCRVIIISDDDAKTVKDKLSQLMSNTTEKYKLGTSSYAQQFANACRVNGGDVDPEEPPMCMDYFMHYLVMPFKFTFALVPPASYGGGWYCFVIALIFIGLVTALIQDLAMLFGCALGLNDMVTAITVVALGTSLPDTFASKAATMADDTADAAIGNVTGSNCVNVFLGLGLPWMIAAIKWERSGMTDEWASRYGDAAGNAGSDALAPNLGKDYPNGGFAVPAGSLGFSVSVFSTCAVCAFALLYYRRRKFGVELGGEQGSAQASAYILFGLWLVYVVSSCIVAQSNS